MGRKWNSRAEDMWGLRSEEVSQKNFLNLDIGLPVEQLRSSIRACLAGETEYEEVTVDATNRRGKAVAVKVTCTPLLAAGDHSVRGVILLLEESNGSR